MWFPTLEKLDNAIFNNIVRLKAVQDRVEAILSESRKLDSLLGPSSEIENLKMRGDNLVQLFSELSIEMRGGNVSVGDVNQRMGTMRKLTEQHEKLCLSVERARAKATLLVDRHFGVPNA